MVSLNVQIRKRKRKRETYKRNKDLVTRLDVDVTTGVIHGDAGLSLAVGSEGSVDTDSLQAVATQLLLGLLGVLLSQALNLRKMLGTLGRQVVIDDTSELGKLVSTNQ